MRQFRVVLRSGMLGAIVLAWGLTAAGAAAAESQEANGDVTHVTLYRGQALVTRTIEVEGEAGPLAVRVSDLPMHVLGDSLFAEGGDGVDVRAVQYRERPVGEEPQEEARALEEQMQGLNDELARNAAQQRVLQQRLAFLDKMQNFVVPTAHVDLSEGVLDAESLQRLAEFDFSQRSEIAAAQLDLEMEARELARQLELAQRQRAELARSESYTVREAVIFLEKRGGGAGTVRLNYLVSNCGWSPSYTFRTGGDRTAVEMEYNALIRQMSGEDWSNVSLTLSTATPALSAAVPGLAPLHVALVSGQAQSGPTSQSDFESAAGSLRGAQYENAQLAQAAETLDEQLSFNWRGNEVANEYQRLELSAGKMAVEARSLPAEGEGPSLSYDLKTPVTLASRSDQQIVEIASTEFKSDFYHVAVPLLSSYLHRQADIENDSEFDLLGGPMTVYLDDRFVGRGEIPTVARGQTFVVGFGANPQLRAKRELADVTDDIQGGNRKLTYQYRLVIENYTGEAVPVRLYDRLPFSQNDEQIKVSLLETETPLSDDSLYQRTDRPTGILRWDVEVPADASGDAAFMLEFGFAIEFDRNFQIGAPGVSAEKLQEEFYRLQDMRSNY